MTTDEAQLVSAVSMLNALGVEKQPDIEVRPRGKINNLDFGLIGGSPGREPPHYSIHSNHKTLDRLLSLKLW